MVIKNAAGQGAEVVPAFPQGLLTLESFADTELKKKILHFNNALRPASAPYFVPKGVPAPAPCPPANSKAPEFKSVSG